MLNKFHPLSRCKANSGKDKQKCLMHFDTEDRVFVFSNWHKIQLCDKFSTVIFNYLTPFCLLKFGLVNCMILMKEYVSLTIASMKMGKRHFYNAQSNGG